MTTITQFYIPLFVALIGIAYPIILQVIARLDEKYNSENIVKLFNQEPALKWFQWLLYVSLFFVVIWSLHLSPIPYFDDFPYINYSAVILSSASILLLTIAFIRLVNKVLVYYNPAQLIDYLANNHFKVGEKSQKAKRFSWRGLFKKIRLSLFSKNRRQNDAEDLYRSFIAQSDILAISIKKEWEQHYGTLSGFFKKAFRLQREKQAENPVKYPSPFYKAAFKIMEEIVRKQPPLDSHLYEDLSSVNWLLGIGAHPQMQEDSIQLLEEVTWKTVRTQISLDTNISIWKCLCLITEYKHADILHNYWKKASRYYNNSFISSSTSPSENENSKEDDNHPRISIEEEKENYQLVHYALGGLLLYHEMYESIEWILKNEFSSPKRIFAVDITEIFEWFFKISSFEGKFHNLFRLYRISIEDPLFPDSTSRQYTLHFIALIFLKRYITIPFSIYPEGSWRMPTLPTEKPQISFWKDSLPNFENAVIYLSKDSGIMNDLGFGEIISHYFNSHNKYNLPDYFQELKRSLLVQYEKSKKFSG